MPPLAGDLEELALVELPGLARRARGTPSRPWRTGAGCPAARRRRTSWRAGAAASSMLPETSSAKITAALIAGVARLTSWRKRRSSLVNGDRALLDRAALDRFLHGAAAVQARARAALVPALAHVVGLVHRRGCASASSRAASAPPTASRRSRRSSARARSGSRRPRCRPPARPASPSLAAGLQHVAGLRRGPGPRPASTCASARRKRACSRNCTGTSTVRFCRARSSGRRRRGDPAGFPCTASRTFSLCRSQSRRRARTGRTRAFRAMRKAYRPCQSPTPAPAAW